MHALCYSDYIHTPQHTLPCPPREHARASDDAGAMTGLRGLQREFTLEVIENVRTKIKGKWPHTHRTFSCLPPKPIHYLLPAAQNGKKMTDGGRALHHKDSPERSHFEAHI